MNSGKMKPRGRGPGLWEQLELNRRSLGSLLLMLASITIMAVTAGSDSEIGPGLWIRSAAAIACAAAAAFLYISMLRSRS